MSVPTWPPDSNLPPADDEQKHAAELLRANGALLVDGAPGTGKTFLAVYLALCATRQGWTNKRQPALLLTFSRNARVQLEHEVDRFVDQQWMTRDEKRAVQVSNYHAFFFEHIGKRAGLWGCCTELRPAGILEANERMVACLPEACGVEPRIASQCLARCRFAAGEFCDEPPDIDSDVEETLQRSVIDGLRRGRPSYDDFAPLFLNLLELSSGYLEWFRLRHPLLIVDEFQDTDRVQYEILKHLAPERLVLLCDKYQMIYQWRGARAERPHMACRDFRIGAARKVHLTRIHRTGDQHSLAQFIQELRRDDLCGHAVSTGRKEWLSLRAYAPRSGWQDLQRRWQWVIQRVARYTKSLVRRADIRGRTSVGILARHNHVAEEFSLMMRSRQEFSSGSGLAPTSCRYISSEAGSPEEGARDLVRQLASISNGQSLLPWMGAAIGYLLPPGYKYGGRDIPIEEEFTGERCPYGRRRVDVLVELRELWEPYFESLHLCRRWRSLAVGLDLVMASVEKLTTRRFRVDPDARHYIEVLRSAIGSLPGDMTWLEGCLRLEDRLLQAAYLRLRRPVRGVHVMTVHQAKGREFDWVIIPWIGEWRDTHPFDLDDAGDRRLLYVAFTRAKRGVTLVYPSYLVPSVIERWGLADAAAPST